MRRTFVLSSALLGLATASALLGLATASALVAQAGKVEGSYLGNGKEAKLAFVRAIPHEGWDGQKAYTLILSSKDPSTSEKPDFDAMFGKLGDALVLAVTVGGDIFSTQVCHQSLDKAGFSTSGTLKVEGFKIEGGKLSGRFTSDGEQEFFDDRWLVDLKVEAALP